MTITAIRPTGEVILFKFCTDVEGHYRSAYIRSDGTFVSDADVDPHTRCIYQGFDSGVLLASGGELVKGYYVNAHNPIRNVGGQSYLGRIYFRTEEEAQQFVAELKELVKPSTPVGWKVRPLVNPKPAAEFDIPYEAKLRSGIRQLRSALQDEAMDMPRVYARLGISHVSSAAEVAQETAESARKRAEDIATEITRAAEKRAEDIAKATQSELRSIERKLDALAESMGKRFDRIDKKLDEISAEVIEWGKRLFKEIQKAINSTTEERLQQLRKLTNEFINLEKTEKVEQRNIEVISNRMKKLKDPKKIERDAKALAEAKARLKRARTLKTMTKKAIDAINDIMETGGKAVKKINIDDIIDSARKIDTDDVIDIIRRLD